MESRAALLAQFTDLLNEHGPDSVELREFVSRHQANKGLLKLFETAITLQAQLRDGTLTTRPGDLAAAKSAASKESVRT
jgi:hypothetical protein